MIELIPARLDRALRQTLAPGERVLVQLKGAFTEALVCTDFRVLILKGGWMTGQFFGTNTFQCPYGNIAGVEVKFHLMTGYFELSAGGMQNTPKGFWRMENKPRAADALNCVSLCGQDQASKFRQACAFIMARQAGRQQPYPSGGDAVSALERLARMRASGVLSEAEFRKMKAQLLANV
jgi:hypothetical protein